MKAVKVAMNMIALDKYFHHPFFSVFFWFASMGVCLPLYWIFLARRNSSITNNKPPMPLYMGLIPAICDVCGMSANLIGMSLVYGSIYQMV